MSNDDALKFEVRLSRKICSLSWIEQTFHAAFEKWNSPLGQLVDVFSWQPRLGPRPRPVGVTHSSYFTRSNMNFFPRR